MRVRDWIASPRPAAALSGEEDIRPLRGDGRRAGPQVETAIGVHLHEARALPNKDQLRMQSKLVAATDGLAKTHRAQARHTAISGPGDNVDLLKQRGQEREQKLAGNDGSPALQFARRARRIGMDPVAISGER